MEYYDLDISLIWRRNRSHEILFLLPDLVQQREILIGQEFWALEGRKFRQISRINCELWY